VEGVEGVETGKREYEEGNVNLCRDIQEYKRRDETRLSE